MAGAVGVLALLIRLGRGGRTARATARRQRARSQVVRGVFEPLDEYAEWPWLDNASRWASRSSFATLRAMYCPCKRHLFATEKDCKASFGLLASIFRAAGFGGFGVVGADAGWP